MLVRALFVLVLAISCGNGRAQNLLIPPDSSYLDFSKLARVSFQRVARSGKVTYSMTQTEFKKLIVTARFILNQNTLLTANEVLLQANSTLLDSARKVLALKYNAELERTKLFESAYDAMKETSNTLQAQLNQCAADLRSREREAFKSKRQSFLKGTATGLLFFTTFWLTLGDR